MTSASVELRPWSRRRWWALVWLIFGVQLGLIFWLGDSSRIRPRPAATGFTFKLAGSDSVELLALNDPTLFVLPHRQRAVGPASLGASRPESHSSQWPEPTNSPLVAGGQLGAAFSHLIETNDFSSLQLPVSLKPKLTRPSLLPLAVSSEQSTLRLEWALAQRRLVTPLSLPSWPKPYILSNSVVRIAVDAEGRPVSPTLLSRSGSSEADQYALEQALAARFDPVRRNPANATLNPAADLSWGRMIFRWHTVPPPPTNAPAASP